MQRKNKNFYRPRRGMTVLVVLGLIAITMALSYAVLHSQTVGTQIQFNARQNVDARQAAIAGLNIALRKMHEADWEGVDRPVSGEIDPFQRYVVTYATGDPRLDANDPEFAEYPYRVTVVSTGYAYDPTAPDAAPKEHSVRAIVQLVRRKVFAPPSQWNYAREFTAYQWGSQAAAIDPPVRIEGPVALQGPLELATTGLPNVSRPFRGRIDEVALYNSALSSSQISNVYLSTSVLGFLYPNIPTQYNNAGPPRAWWRLNEAAGSTFASDARGLYPGTYEYNALPGVAAGPGAGSGNAALFDGRYSRVNLGAVDIPGNQMTVLAWFRMDAPVQANSRIISKATGLLTTQHYWVLTTYPSGNNVRLRFLIRTGNTVWDLTASSGNIPAGEWVFAAATYDGSNMRLYLNGNLVGTRSASGNIATSNNIPAFIGENPPGNVWATYLRELGQMNANGAGDYRPLTGPLSLAQNPDAVTAEMLTSGLGLTTQQPAQGVTAPVGHPGSVSSYRLYPGGRSYAVQPMGTNVSHAAFAPDAMTNPLGVYGRRGEVRLNNHVGFRGAMIIDGGNDADLVVAGNHVNLEGIELPPLDDGTIHRLPVVLARDGIVLRENCGATVRGALYAGGTFDLLEGSGSVKVEIEGNVLANRLQLRGRASWVRDENTWLQNLSDFLVYRNSAGAAGSNLYFPVWMNDQYHVTLAPALTIAPPAAADDGTAAPVNHWHDWREPVFVPHDDDDGLRWNLLDWSEL